MTRKSRALQAYRASHRHIPWQIIYVHRDTILRDMGFPRYADYLDSELWQGIRKLAMAKNGGRCIRCQRKATQVHHAKYDRPTLAGDDPTHLYPVCHGCHRRAECSSDGRKRSLFDANAYLGAITPDEIDRFDPTLYHGYRKSASSGQKRRSMVRRRNAR